MDLIRQRSYKQNLQPQGGEGWIQIQKVAKRTRIPEDSRVANLWTYGKGEWSSTKKNPYESIARGLLTKEAKAWFYFIG